jgi:hypothetical protein
VQAILAAEMWATRALDPPHVCEVCKSGSRGPFWIGPKRPTRIPGPSGALQTRIAICSRCMFVAVDGEGSPYEGQLRRARDAERVEADLRTELARRQAEVDQLRAELREPEVIARRAVAAALDELRAAGALG